MTNLNIEEETKSVRASLSTLLKEGTKQAHVQAERSSFMTRLIRGNVDRNGYAHYLDCLLYVYEALEDSALARESRPLLADLCYPELDRVDALRADLRFFLGTELTRREVSPSTATYVERIRWSAQDRPHCYIAHAYTRYLGDLSGGQILARLIRGHYDLEGSEGLAFYSFPAIDDKDAFKALYRERLDALPLSPLEQNEIVQEANRSFALNQALFEELDREG